MPQTFPEIRTYFSIGFLIGLVGAKLGFLNSFSQSLALTLMVLLLQMSPRTALCFTAPVLFPLDMRLLLPLVTAAFSPSS